MPILDLGFSSFEQAAAIVKDSVDRSNSCYWMCDWERVSFLDKINFICDATMYRLYCAEFDIPCDYSDEECIELAQKYKEQVYKFQQNLLQNIVKDVFARWVGYIHSGDVIPQLPPSAKIALINFTSIASKLSGSELAPHFIGMFGSLSEAHTTKTSCTFDVSDVQETISVDQFDSYCRIIEPLLTRPFESKNEDDLKRFNVRIALVKKILMSILWMCEPVNYNGTYESDTLFDRWILPYMQSSPEYEPYLKMFMNRKSMPIAYAICVTPETVKLIPEDIDSYPITDAIRLALTLVACSMKDTECFNPKKAVQI